MNSNSTKRLREANNTNSSADRHDSKRSKGGLGVEIHPFLKSIVPIPQLPKDFNPLSKSASNAIDSTKSNPYLDSSTPQASRRTRKGAFEFNHSGKYVEIANQIREQEAAKSEQLRKHKILASKGLVPNDDLGESLYSQECPADDTVEWWDAYYVNGDKYRCTEQPENIILDNEEAPVSLYIQHPVFLKAAYEKHMPVQQPLYLTKKEMKRKRKIERQEKLKAQQERVKKGLEPPPPPKVKLSNIMSVLTNEAIKDPTAVEKRVKKEVEARFNKHIQQNEERRLTKEQSHQKLHERREHDLSKGYFRAVYKIQTLVDPQHFFKIDKNAQQLELKGVCIAYNKMSLVVVEGGSKSLKYYDKLITRRIDWTKSNRSDVDLSENRATKVWEGQIKDLQFQKWSVLKPRDDTDLTSMLSRFSLQNYWREALLV
ncbi:U4/U5/U6 small nuclear ribonucleoprotein prp3 [Yamadazyma tenuis]|uniref:Pre-mRNA-splicing factor 3 n=1 Tax=Candida tenuis (strain ATCC 10573 / BCRC 21748 / CBS 615 / JCM 9827 / NBRC 10315 / NRRL Y-1498 / VKM Y-70) TaxID=590646 RepID=G3AZ93_CANTC|nr:uncharacterized protein CANTEDRAFT_101276 [Yamadazyma tenuis ATCC 10573]EGV66039.1 hypothetical protein CANTEDRAFT_101276 [Yamadazyma tenuis ATCC 10573]WEJ95620.1 U4/U5/U6 small nuclear ribonucleoprotein prp3 [Yamadazyma tenuis]